MNPTLVAGTLIVNIALISYTIFIFFERKYRKPVNSVLLFISIGVVFDVTATICMIIGSSKSPFSLHGLLGYSALAGMLADAILIWRHKIRNGIDNLLSRSVHTYSLIAYLWWLTAYITGALLVMMRYR